MPLAQQRTDLVLLLVTVEQLVIVLEELELQLALDLRVLEEKFELALPVRVAVQCVDAHGVLGAQLFPHLFCELFLGEAGFRLLYERVGTLFRHDVDDEADAADIYGENGPARPRATTMCYIMKSIRHVLICVRASDACAREGSFACSHQKLEERRSDMTVTEQG